MLGMKKYIQWVVVPVLLFVMVAPQGAQASTYVTSTANQQQIAYLYSIVAQLQAQLNALLAAGVVTSYVGVQTDGVDSNDDSVELSGRVTFKRDGDARVWFEYGLTNTLSYSTQSADIDNGDQNETTSFSMIVPDLDTNRSYYYRAVAEGEDGRYAEGSIRSFTYTGNSSSNSSNDDVPQVNVDSADNVDENSAELSGAVDMNDYENGLAFMVYGEDESSIDDVEDDNQYSDVDENGDDLQKVLLSSSLDDDRDFTVDVSSLNDNTEYFFRMCVEYDDEDNDETLVCSSVKSFETDNN